MATAKKPTAISYVTKLQTMIAGLTTSAPTALKSMIIGGTSFTIAQVIAQLQSFLGLFNNVTNTHQTWRAAVAAKKAGLAAGRLIYDGVVVMLKQYFGTNQAALAAFGITVPAPRAKASTTTKAIAQAKALATRQARNTKGSKQRLSITATPQPSMAVTLPGVGSGSPGGTPPAAAPAAALAPAPAAAPAAPPVAPIPVVPNPGH